MFTEEHNKFILEAYFRTGERDEENNWKYSYISCFNQFEETFPDIEVVQDMFRQHVRRILERFRGTGSICKGKSSGRSKTLTEEAVEDIRQRIEVSPKKSLRQLSLQTDISYGSCRTALKKVLHMAPYKVSVVHELSPVDFQRRVNYCHWFNRNLNDDNILDLTFFTDEAWIHLDGYINSQNYRTWATENPHQFHEKGLHPIKIGVWVAMSRRRIIGSIFFYNTVTAENYRQQILQPFLEQLHDDELRYGYFQQDNATAHTAIATVEHLQQFYDNRLITRDIWPPRSPDLTPLDFFMFGYLKTKIFRNRIHTVEELEQAVINETHAISPEVLQNVFNNMKSRISLCLQYNGEHFQHLI